MKRLILCGITAALLAGCASTKVARIDPSSQTDLSGKWNDTDSRMVSDEMITDCFNRPWYATRFGNAGIIPTIIIGDVRNRSHEHINVETFTKDIERTLLNSGKVQFVAKKIERSQVREEKADQMAGNATQETTKELGNETGADLMLIGSINTIADQVDNKQAMYYQVNMELVDIKSNMKLWIGDKKIKKMIKRAHANW